MIKEKLVDVGAWAQSRVDSGEEPPWTFHKLKLLAELARELSEGLDASQAYTPGLNDDEQISAETFENVVRFERPAVEPPTTNLPA